MAPTLLIVQLKCHIWTESVKSQQAAFRNTIVQSYRAAVAQAIICAGFWDFRQFVSRRDY
jgi:hypothetical protein